MMQTSRISWIVGALLLLVTSPIASAQALDQIQSAVRATENQAAKFTQRFLPHGSTQEQVERGTVLFGTLPNMRWTYRAPEPKVFVFDGHNSWMYLPAERQVSFHRLSSDEREELPFLLLKDREAIQRDFDVKSASSGQRLTITLTPKRETRIRSLVVDVDRRSGIIRSLSYSDLEGNRTTFEFQGHRRVTPGPETFRFEAPSGVEVVEY
jgi:chaperone LolA